MSDDDQQTSQADELTEMWDADSLREAGLDLDSPPSATATNAPKTAPDKQDEPSVSVDDSEVAPGDHEWDANVGMRLTYKLSALALDPRSIALRLL